jgi:hypothetical protein
MDFYLSCIPCLDCDLEPKESSAHRVILQILNLFVALFLDQQTADYSKTVKIPATIQTFVHENANSNKRALREIELVLDAIPVAGHTALASLDSANWASKSVSLGL